MDAIDVSDHALTEADTEELLAQPASSGDSELVRLLGERPARAGAHPVNGVVVGTLVGIAEAGRTPMVLCPERHGSDAVRARSLLDLRAEHIGREVALTYENGDIARPIVVGVLQQESRSSLDAPQHVTVETDGERLVVVAREQLVLRCGDASITLTKAGKVLIAGRFVSSESSGVNRIKGGSIQLN